MQGGPTLWVLVVTLVWSCLAWLASPLLLDKRWLQAGRLEGEQHRLLQVEVPSLIQCLHLCLGRARCLSLDFQPNSGRCQLNVHSLESMAGLSLGDQQTAWQHLERQHFQQADSVEDVAGPCSSLVCLEQEVCASRDCETAVCIPDGLPPPEITTAEATTAEETTTTEAATTAAATTSETATEATAGGTATSTTTPETQTALQTPSSEAITTAETPPAAAAAATTAIAVITTTPALALTTPSPFPDVDCGSPPAAPDGMTLVSSSGTRYHDTARYTCNAGTAWPDSGFLLCNESSMWQGDPGGCSYTDCYDPGLPSSYAGKLNVTPSGITCQRWDTTKPVFHLYVFKAFHKVDGSAKAANNYCRAIADRRPWCYRSTSATFKRFEYCSIPQC